MQKDKCYKSDLLIVSRAKIPEPFGSSCLIPFGRLGNPRPTIYCSVMIGAVRAPHLHTTS